MDVEEAIGHGEQPHNGGGHAEAEGSQEHLGVALVDESVLVVEEDGDNPLLEQDAANDSNHGKLGDEA